jgi:hypothetical protein
MKRFLFSADLTYTFRQHKLDTCANCEKTRDEHSEDDCLFEASRFQKHQLREFLELLMQKGADLTITCGPYELKQMISPAMFDALQDKVLVDFSTVGDAFLEVK